MGEFRRRRAVVERIAVDGRDDRNNRPFVLADRLFDDDESLELFTTLWTSAYMSRFDDPPDPTIDQILDDSRRIFCILLDLGYPLFITRFRQTGLTDNKLPIPPERGNSEDHDE